MQGRKIVEQDGVEPVGCRALAREAAHPDPVRRQQVVERAVHAFEEGTAIGAVLFIGQGGRGGVEVVVGPSVVAGQRAEALGHGAGLSSVPVRPGRLPGHSASRAA